MSEDKSLGEVIELMAAGAFEAAAENIREKNTNADEFVLYRGIIEHYFRFLDRKREQESK